MYVWYVDGVALALLKRKVITTQLPSSCYYVMFKYT